MFRMTRFIFALILVTVPGHMTEAKKCPFFPYRIQGRVDAVANDIDPQTVRVLIFLEHAAHTSDYPPEAGEDDYATPDASGRFEFVSYLSTTASNGSCTRFATNGEAIFLGPGLRARREIFSLPPKQRIRREGGVELDIGDVRLRVTPAE